MCWVSAPKQTPPGSGRGEEKGDKEQTQSVQENWREELESNTLWHEAGTGSSGSLTPGARRVLQKWIKDGEGSAPSDVTVCNLAHKRSFLPRWIAPIMPVGVNCCAVYMRNSLLRNPFESHGAAVALPVL